MLEMATVEDFAPHVGTVFALRLEDSEALLTLTGAGQFGENNICGRPFSLLFSGPARPALPQSIYVLSHAKLGELEIFLVPISGDKTQRVYEAVFA